MDENKQGPKLDETKQFPKADEPKSVPNQGETKQMPWSYEDRQMPPKTPASAQSYGEAKPASATSYGPLRQSSSVASGTKEESKPAPKVAESKTIPMPAPKVVENKKVPKPDTRKVIKIPRRRFVIVSIIILVVLILLAVVIASLSTNTFGISKNGIVVSNPAPSMESLGDSLAKGSPQNNYIGGFPAEPSISDTREFLKTNYSATIRTRKVEEVVSNVQNIVKGANGRIDSINSSPKSGYVRFVVAKSKFDTFKSQMESITNKKLYIENISSENLLGQKQGIEAQTGNIVNTLTNLNTQKQNLDKKHTLAVNSINAGLARIRVELTAIRAAITTTTEPSTLPSLRSQESSYVQQETAQIQLLNKENSNYAIQSKNLENSMNREDNNLTDINQQDSQFTDNIETVSGYVSVYFVNLWEMARIFSPIPPIIIVLILVIIIIFCLRRYSRIPRIELQ